MRVLPAGAHALLIEVDDPAGWRAALVRRREAGQLTATDIVPGARTVLVDGVPDPRRLADALPGWEVEEARTSAGRRPGSGSDGTVRRVEIPVRYTGEDLPDVADCWGCSVEAAVTRLATTDFTVAFCGFAPGFAYLRGLPGRVPRLATPRPAVPAGSVALADGYAGIYPTASPGGWRIVGTSDARLFDVTRDPPALLTPGTLVRLPREAGP